MYRVLDCANGGITDIFFDVFARAYGDGADIIAASLGKWSGWSEGGELV